MKVLVTCVVLAFAGIGAVVVLDRWPALCLAALLTLISFFALRRAFRWARARRQRRAHVIRIDRDWSGKGL